MIYHTAHLDAGKARDLIYEKVHTLYPDNNKIVFVWNAGQVCHSGFENQYAWAKFKAKDDPAYGHDVLILIH